MASIELAEFIEFACPFCGQRAVAGFDIGRPCVMHALPLCPEFDLAEPDAYLRKCNDHGFKILNHQKKALS